MLNVSNVIWHKNPICIISQFTYVTKRASAGRMIRLCKLHAILFLERCIFKNQILPIFKIVLGVKINLNWLFFYIFVHNSFIIWPWDGGIDLERLWDCPMTHVKAQWLRIIQTARIMGSKFTIFINFPYIWT